MTFETLMSTKLRIPAARPDRVSRPDLAARVETGLQVGHVLTLVSAPAGFGKTTLIREWASTSERPVAWLEIDEEDSNPARFLTYLVAAFRQIDDQVGDTLSDRQNVTPRDALMMLINELDRGDTRMALVLDDYHLISTFETHDLMTFFLENCPPGVHVVIGTREDPPLPLARMRARSQMTEIRERDLRFHPEETRAFLNETMNFDLSVESVAALQSRTEGWITGLQLAGLALRQQHDVEAFITAFAGDDRYIVDYLVDEVLDRTTASLRDFLRQTAILERFTAPLCHTLTGRDDSQAVLEYLEHANLFLMPLDNRREWYRYHGLFAEVLRLTLNERERISLHHKAAEWYAAHGINDLAAHHHRALDELSAGTDAIERAANQSLIEPLTEREREVLDLIAAGLTNAEIAERLYIALGTVKRHISNMYGKLNVGSRTQAIAKARDIGLLK
jgi:LuxR family maltose regulon positive regulatory protein